MVFFGKNPLSGVPLLVINNILYLGTLALFCVFFREEFNLPWLCFGLLYAALTEYVIHRGLLHSRFEATGKLHRLHHQSFPAFSMRFHQTHEFHKILFSPATTIAIILIATGQGLLLARAGFAHQGLTIGFALVTYFFLYEWLHLAFHSGTRITRWLWPLRLLRHHHLKHHSHRGSLANFNVVFPAIDFFVSFFSAKKPAKTPGKTRLPG